MGDVVSDAFGFYARDFGRLFAVASPTIPYSIFVAFLGAFVPPEAGIVLVPLHVASYAVIGGAVVAAFAVSDESVHDFSGAYGYVFARLKALLGAALRGTAIVVLFAITLIGLPLAVNRLVRWSFATQAVLLDAQTSATALSFSSDVVKGHWWSTAGRMLAVGLIALLPTMMMVIVMGWETSMIELLIGATLSAMVLPFSMIASTLIYYDLQARKVYG